jgi:hypothetical protein
MYIAYKNNGFDTNLLVSKTLGLPCMNIKNRGAELKAGIPAVVSRSISRLNFINYK